MFTIGFAVGVAASLLVCIIGLSAMTWSVGKDRMTRNKAEERQEELHHALQAYWKRANTLQAEQVNALNRMAKKVPVKLKDGMEVMVYDRYRFSIPLLGRIQNFADGGESVSVTLLESNNAQYPIGKGVWVSVHQIVPTSIDG